MAKLAQGNDYRVQHLTKHKEARGMTKRLYEVEQTEEVERDTVMVMIDGVLTEVTEDDPEAER